ncbi:MAG: sulfite exporter TauE/SafE family protein [Proteobacteria bacterium]|nr:sulfite exporter TauE/SafE family protein [Pseudomonadota bacterium]
MEITTILLASLIVFLFTTVLTVAGVGAAFIIIPTFYWLGVPLTEAMAIALLLNAISMSFASVNYIRYKLVNFKTAMPIIILAVFFSPLGAYSTRYFPKNALILIFIFFLIFAGSMMLFYTPKKKRDRGSSSGKELKTGIGLGIGAGYLGGLLGVGGGNFIVPALIWLGFDPKNASATTAFIVVFASLSGFFGHAALGNINWNLLAFSAVGSIAGALVGSWLMHRKLEAKHVKRIIGFVLYAIAAKMLWSLLRI